jgi:hypothetical protein
VLHGMTGNEVADGMTGNVFPDVERLTKKTTRSLPKPFSPSPEVPSTPTRAPEVPPPPPPPTRVPVSSLSKSIVKSLPPLGDSFIHQWYQVSHLRIFHSAEKLLEKFLSSNNG